MNLKLEKFKAWIRDGGHKKFRQTGIPDLIVKTKIFEDKGIKVQVC